MEAQQEQEAQQGRPLLATAAALAIFGATATAASTAVNITARASAALAAKSLRGATANHHHNNIYI